MYHLANEQTYQCFLSGQVGCKQHFMMDAKQQAGRLPRELREPFMTACRAIKNSKTVFDYEVVLDKLRVSVAPYRIKC